MAEAARPSDGSAGVHTMAEGGCTGEHFVEKHQVNLIKRVSNIAPILDELLHENIIQRDSYDEIQALPTSQEKMAALFSGPLESSGGQGKAMFYRILNEHERYLIDELRRTEVPVETMTTAKELLLETLNDLSSKELKKFKWLLQFNFLHWGLPQMVWSRLLMAHRADDLAVVMVQIWNQQSVEVTKEVFMDMNRTDLVQRLSETSSEPKEKHTVDEHWPGLIQKVETMASVIELLLETLAGLSDEEVNKFKLDLWSQPDFHRQSSDIQLMLFEVTDNQDMVFLMVLIYRQHSVNKTKEVLKEMNRTDLVQRLSHSSSGPKKKLSDEHRSALIQRVATKVAVKQMLLETLNDLNLSELKKFQEFLQLIVSQNNLPDISSMLIQTADSEETVDLMMQLYGHQSVDLTTEVVKKIKRTDLMWRWSESSSDFKGFITQRVIKWLYPSKEHSVDEHQPSLSESEATMPSVQEKLLETLQDLNYEDLEKFKHVLQYSKIKKGLPRIPRKRLETADRVEMVKLMMETYGQQSVEVTEEVLKARQGKTRDPMKMNWSGLVERSEPTLVLSGFIPQRVIKWLYPSKEHSVDEHQPSMSEIDVTMTSVQEKLLETLEDLSYGELEQFKHVLQRTRMKKGLPRMSRQRMETADKHEIVELMMEIYKQQSVEVTSDVLMEMNRRDLVKRLSDFSSGSKGPSRSLDHEDCGSIMISSDWSKLEPEVNSKDADEAPTYSLQSEAGHFECSVSGLRWICKGKVRFKYQFCPWEEPMERMNSMQYMAAGPLMNITVLAGKLDEVHLPHWICIEDNPAILDKFAVLHIDDCGDHVEKVSEVTSSHVKLCEPVFSPRAVLMRVGFSVKINCNVLIYKTNTAFLTLHVYVIPRDPGLQQELDKREISYGYKVIRKPNPEKSLKIKDRFILTAVLEGAEINPGDLKLRYESRTPNFFEVYTKNPDTDFVLKLNKKTEHQPVWTCTIRKDEYQSIVHSQGEHFVDQHRCDLIDRVNNINTILDNLLTEGVISQEDYDTMSAIPTTQEKMRKLYRGPLKAAGHDGKDVFYKILEDKESYLVADLKRKGS
ncbi:uncharacterized protein [Cebidichthys violaceus]|uniref:uncharacterized protein isoform X2 n=1 Tax=Cebidichthys violaceus TaxID=271503 RepID=UPI0035CA085B